MYLQYHLSIFLVLFPTWDCVNFQKIPTFFILTNLLQSQVLEVEWPQYIINRKLFEYHQAWSLCFTLIKRDLFFPPMCTKFLRKLGNSRFTNKLFQLLPPCTRTMMLCDVLTPTGLWGSRHTPSTFPWVDLVDLVVQAFGLTDKTWICQGNSSQTLYSSLNEISGESPTQRTRWRQGSLSAVGPRAPSRSSFGRLTHLIPRGILRQHCWNPQALFYLVTHLDDF